MSVDTLKRFAESLSEKCAGVPCPNEPVELVVRQDYLSFLVEDEDDIEYGTDEAVQKRNLRQSSRLGQDLLA